MGQGNYQWMRVPAGLVLGLALACVFAGCRVFRPLAATVIPDANSYASDFSEAERKLVEFARDNPLSPNRDLVQTSEDVKRGIPEFGWLLNLPLSPCRALEGVNETANSVHELTVVADRFTRNMQDLPRDAAWESELLLLKTRSESGVV